MTDVGKITKLDATSVASDGSTGLIKRNSVFERRKERRIQRYNDSSDEEQIGHRIYVRKPKNESKNELKNDEHRNKKRGAGDDMQGNVLSPEKRQMLHRFDSVDCDVVNAKVDKDLGKFEKKGEMKQVFGPQSILSQELKEMECDDGECDGGTDPATAPAAGVSQTLEYYDKKGSLKHAFGSQSVLSQELEKFKAGNIPSSDVKDGNSRDDDSETVLHDNDNSSDISSDKEEDQPNSIAISSLPDLPISQLDSVMGSQTQNTYTMWQAAQPDHVLSQVSAMSGYDLIIGAAQALAERDGEEQVFDDNEDQADANHAGRYIDALPDTCGSETNLISVGSSTNSADGLSESQASATRVSRRIISLKLKREKSLVEGQDHDGMQMYQYYQGNGAHAPLKDSVNEHDTISTKSMAESQLKSFQKPTRSPPKSKEQKELERREANREAERAAAMVEELRVNRLVEKQLLLSMALARENPRAAPSRNPPRGKFIPVGFYWAQFPPLEKILRAHMGEYYELSITKCQSRAQQTFNNKLVDLVTAEAKVHGWSFDPAEFDDKKIRDRVRCFFKTHIQNAKKRLKTMIKNPTKKANAKALSSHLDLIEKHREESKAELERAKQGNDQTKSTQNGDIASGNVYKEPPTERTDNEQAESEQEYDVAQLKSTQNGAIANGYVYNEPPAERTDYEQADSEQEYDVAQLLVMGFGRLSQGDSL